MVLTSAPACERIGPQGIWVLVSCAKHLHVRLSAESVEALARCGSTSYSQSLWGIEGIQRLPFGRSPLPNVRKRNDATDGERLHDIEQKLRCWGYLSHYPDAEHDVAWLLDQLAEPDARRGIGGTTAAELMGVLATVTCRSATGLQTTSPGRSPGWPPARSAAAHPTSPGRRSDQFHLERVFARIPQGTDERLRRTDIQRGCVVMPRYLIRASYTAEGTKGLIKAGGGTARRAAVQEMLRPLGGELEAFYYALGDEDACVIVSLPDNVSAAAISLAVNASGAVNLKTTVLLTPEEIDQAARKSVNYRVPGS
jgi:uncharacterized protein with GYD domain